MKTNTEMRNVTTNVGERNAFTIKATGKAFRVLINGLYADKVQSITREIWSNALDAHAMAGVADRPFDVTFPTYFDPAFRVRDYGVSLSHEQVMRMYTTLFESTKEDTNEQVGKLGLGSKSPFAYTDSFSVTVVLDGKKRFYAAMIGADDVPTINFMGEEDTTEERGVEVSFPVDRSDVSTFAAAAKRISHGFDVKPNVLNADGFSGWPTLTPLMQGKGWKLLSGNIEGYRTQAYAKMGCVLYPINADAIPDISAEDRELLRCPFVIDFDIGDLEITASREELSYGRNEPTSSSVLKRLAEIAADLRDIAAADFAACASYWQACVLFYSKVSNTSLPTLVRNLYRQYGTYEGEKLVEVVNLKAPYWTEICYIDHKAMAKVNLTLKPVGEAAIIAQPNTTFLIEDRTGERKIKRAAARLRHWKRTTNAKQAILIRFTNPKVMQYYLIKWMEQFDGATFINVEDIALPPEQSLPRRPVMPRILVRGDFSHVVQLTEEAMDEGGFMVPLERMVPVKPEGSAGVETIVSLLMRAGAIPKGTEVYGVPKSLRKDFEGEQWVNIFDFAREWVDENCTDLAVRQHRNDAIYEVRNDSMLRFLAKNLSASDLPHASPARDALELMGMAMAETAADIGTLAQLAKAIGHRDEEEGGEGEHILTTMLADVKRRVIDTYPLMQIILNTSFYDDNLVDKLTHYVTVCDKVSETNQQQFMIAAE